MISHDLRNKLNIAHGRLELARETGQEDHFDAVIEALSGVESISELVVTLARSGKPVDRLVEVRLREEVETAFQPLNDPSAQLSVKASARILADPGCLTQLLENLFRNAVEHAGGPVTIEVGLLEDGFYIADNGPGIPEDIRDQVFDLGFSTSAEHDGKGLAIVQRLAEAHGWDVALETSFEGGTRIEIRGVVFK